MKKCFFCFIFVMIVGVAIFAQQPIIAQAPTMFMMNPLTPDEAKTVDGVSDKMLSEAKNLRFINKLVLDKGMRDYQFQPKDWANVEKIIALGEVLNIDWVVRPQLQKRVNNNNSEIIISAALLNVQTQKITCTTPVMLKNVNEAQSKIGSLIDEITQIVNGGTGGIALSNQPSAVYRVGDRGPAGGYVFYDKGSYSDGWRYLEIAPQGTEATLPIISNMGEKIEGTYGKENTEIGSGKRNTDIILQANQNHQKDYQVIKAAKICASMDFGWFRDWFLPSQGELQHLATRPGNSKIGGSFGGFSVGYYITSTTNTDSVAINISDTRRYSDYKERFIRAVRAF